MENVRRFTQDEVNGMVKDYNNGMIPKDMGLKYNTNPATVIGKLKTLGIYVNSNNRWSKEEISYLKSNYPNGDWNELLTVLNRHSKSEIIHKASKLKIKKEDFGWSKENVELLILSHNNGLSNNEISLLFNNKYTIGSISTKLNKLGLKRFDPWTDDEIQILKDYYETTPMDDIEKMLPNRKRFNIIRYANTKLGLVSVGVWRENEKQYIMDNWELTPDIIMAKKLNRTFRSVKWQREQLGLYRQNKSEKNYKTISKYIRANINEWKNNSMESSSYKCVLTGNKDFQIHHLQSVSLILKTTFKELNIEPKEEFKDYTEDELKLILEKFIEIQDRYPLGECISKKLHVLFHSLFGQYYNIPEQWYRFKEDYLNGLYNDMLKKSA